MSKPLPRHRVDGTGDDTIFLFHGAYGDGRYFKGLSDHLVRGGYRVVTWDCPGYGGSPALPESTVEAFAEAAARLVDEVGTENNYLLGHSMGSLIAPRAALLTKRHIAGVVLSAASPGFKARSPEDQERFLAERLDPIRSGMSVAEYAPGLLKTMMGPDASGPAVDEVVRVVSEMDTDVFERSLIALTQYDGRPALSELKAPTLLIAGEVDTACPPRGMRVMEDLLSDATYVELEGTGHYGFAEDFDEFVAPIDAFLDKIRGGAR